ncbi:MAG: pilus assembly protein N-terminal domain-containing protein [Verrucomicrobiae bacterium]|nr:pilus assembly protein N-terminal domain-containing protein [Verrucomicrobiae bacterium]
MNSAFDAPQGPAVVCRSRNVPLLINHACRRWSAWWAAAALGVTVCVAQESLVRTNTLCMGEAQIFPATGSNVVIATEGIVRALPAGPGKLVLSAVKEGRTDVMVLDEAGQPTERYVIIVTEKRVGEQMLYQASLDDFKRIVRQMAGDHNVQFDVLVGPRLMFDGTNLTAMPHPVLFMHGEAKDEIQADTIRSIASRFYGQGDFGSSTTTSTPNTTGYTGTNTTTATITDLKNDPNIVDQITIATHHQVRIRIQVAEVNTEALKRKGIRYSDYATWGIGAPNAITLDALGQTAIKNNFVTGLVVPQGGTSTEGLTPAFQATLHLLVSDGYARLLSEPVLVTKSGHEASFLAGGQLYLQQTTANTSTTTVVPFGVRMTIKPRVDRAKHIDIEVFTEVSQRPEPITTGSRDYVINTRNSQTKLRMNPGDVLVLSGLLDNNMRNAITKIPWLGQIPVLGALFRSKEWQHNQTELLFFITPEIVGELTQDTARQIQTPAMKQWHYLDSHKDVLADPNSHASPDNDVHDLLGLPPDRMHYQEPPPATSPFVPAPAPAAAAKPASSKPLFPPPSADKTVAPSEPAAAKPERKYN